MSRTLAPPVIFGLAVLAHSQALAQRTQENAITSASDAFGTSIGNETIGLYRDTSVRGFSPITAGNRRLEGLYFDLGGNGLTPRWTSRSVVRVGLPALNYPFPAPSGIVDYSLRPSGDATAASVAVGLSEYGGYFAELDAQLAQVPERLSAAVGGHYQRRVFEDDRYGDYGALAVVPTLRFAHGSITPFWSAAVQNVDAAPLMITSGPWLPPKVAGGELPAQHWARNVQRSRTYGVLARHDLGAGFTFRVGAFESRSVRTRTYLDLYHDVQPDGRATNVMIAEPRLPARWTSGEARLSWNEGAGNLEHELHLSLRGRDKRLEIGGSASALLGDLTLGERVDRPKPDFAFTPIATNSVRQWIAGLASIGRWRGVLEWNVGVQRTGYRYEVRRPAGTAASRADPWLYNATLAVTPTPWLAVYGGYTRGLEETASPPPNAANRDDAVPASRTEQVEAGVRLAAGSARLVAALFQIERPYFSLDAAGVYGPLGTFRNRGIEVSLTAQPLDGLSAVAGLALLDPEVIGEAVRTGRAGPRAVATPVRTARLDLDYRTPLPGLSFDASVQHLGPSAASTLGFAELDGRQLTAPGETTIDLGARYRFTVGTTPVALRLLAANLFDVRRYEVRNSQVFFARRGRRFSLQLSADF